MPNCTLALEANAELGECPRWHVAERKLYWVDIARCELHRFDPATGRDEARHFAAPVGCFAFLPDGGFLLGMKQGFARLESWEGEPHPFGEPIFADKPDLRMNDGRTDAQGRFWAGSVNMAKSARDAALYRLDGDGSITCVEGGMLTCNGAAFDASGRHFCHTDTPSHALRLYDVDGAAGEISHGAILHRFPMGEGRPDGGSFDAEGHYWSALFDGGRVVRLSPAGEIVQTVALPVSRPTMIAFGGVDLRTAYVTTARTGLSPEQREQQPLAGGIFSFPVDVPGLPEHPFRPSA
ncbi:MAG: SMP-30/gluconolactonase/LRE family protein [Sphingobium sp.]